MKCEICGKDILRDSQCINYKYYHNDCIENLQQENQELHNKIDKAIEYIESKEYEYGDEEQDNYIYDIGFDEVNELLDILKWMK